ncbi:hypothetical protein V2J09_004029 [Rumex salicifolius]
MKSREISTYVREIGVSKCEEGVKGEAAFFGSELAARHLFPRLPGFAALLGVSFPGAARRLLLRRRFFLLCLLRRSFVPLGLLDSFLDLIFVLLGVSLPGNSRFFSALYEFFKKHWGHSSSKSWSCFFARVEPFRSTVSLQYLQHQPLSFARQIPALSCSLQSVLQCSINSPPSPESHLNLDFTCDCFPRCASASCMMHITHRPCLTPPQRLSLTASLRPSSSVSPCKSEHSARFVNRGCKLVGCGSAAPKLQISNDDLAKIVETSDEWIAVRTGIRRRHVLSEKESLTAMAAEAAKNALQMAQVDPDDVDLILMCTSTPEDLFGSAPQIQRALGCRNNPLSYDITAACSGFVLGLVSAGCHIRGGGFKNVLVIAADALSRYVDWTDRGTCILFGDAAGAVLVQACDIEEDGLFSFDLHSDGEGLRHLNASMRYDESNNAVDTHSSFSPGFPPGHPTFSTIQMNGKEVFRFAVRCVPQSLEAALKKAGLTGSSIDWLLLHQANQRIIDAVGTRLEVPPERIISNIANYGNTSAASIPLALDEAVRSGKVEAGHVIATSGFGAGLTWGSAVVRWVTISVCIIGRY